MMTLSTAAFHIILLSVRLNRMFIYSVLYMESLLHLHYSEELAEISTATSTAAHLPGTLWYSGLYAMISTAAASHLLSETSNRMFAYSVLYIESILSDEDWICFSHSFSLFWFILLYGGRLPWKKIRGNASILYYYMEWTDRSPRQHSYSYGSTLFQRVIYNIHGSTPCYTNSPGFALFQRASYDIHGSIPCAASPQGSTILQGASYDIHGSTIRSVFILIYPGKPLIIHGSTILYYYIESPKKQHHSVYIESLIFDYWS